MNVSQAVVAQIMRDLDSIGVHAVDAKQRRALRCRSYYGKCANGYDDLLGYDKFNAQLQPQLQPQISLSPSYKQPLLGTSSNCQL